MKVLKRVRMTLWFLGAYEQLKLFSDVLHCGATRCQCGVAEELLVLLWWECKQCCVNYRCMLNLGGVAVNHAHLCHSVTLLSISCSLDVHRCASVVCGVSLDKQSV